MLSDEFLEVGVEGPKPQTPASCTLHIHVDNAHDFIASAVKAGATVEREAKDECYGECSGVLRDPFGHRWLISHRWLIGHSIEGVSPEEMQRRYVELMSASVGRSGS